MKLVTQSELARTHGVSHVTISHWRKRGCPHRRLGKHIMFNPPAVQAWLDERSTAKRRGDLARVAKAEAQAALAKLRLDVSTGKLLPRPRVVEIIRNHLGNFRNNVLAIGSRAAPLCVGLKDADEIKAVLDKLMRDALQSLDGMKPQIDALGEKRSGGRG